MLRHARTRFLAWLLIPLCTSVLSACGGGVGLSVGIGSDYDNDSSPPSVSIAVADGVVFAGQVIAVAAAASDESGIESVTLYRRDFAGDRLISSLGTRPYEWLVAVPTDGRSSVTYYAQAVDNSGNRANSSTVTLSVSP